MQAAASTMAQQLLGDEEQLGNICPYCGKPIIYNPHYNRLICSLGCEREGKYI